MTGGVPIRKSGVAGRRNMRLAGGRAAFHDGDGMNIVIVGAGEVGSHLAENLSAQAHNIYVVDKSAGLASELNEKLDARVVCGAGSSVSALEEAMIAEADLLLALTSDDSVNLVTCSVGKALGARRALCRVHAGIQREEWLFNYREHFGIDYLFSSERLAAVELAKFIRNPDSLLVEEIARGRIELQQVVVDEGCDAIGRALAGLGLPPRVRIGPVRRGGTQFLPGAGDALQAGDRVTLFGEPRNLGGVARMLQAKSPQPSAKNVVIFGGSECGVALAQMLESGNDRVRVFERDRQRCGRLAQLLQSTTIINADATSLPHLREEQVGEADFFVAVTDQDEDNVMTCLQASNLGTGRTLALIHRADYADAIQRSGAELGIMGAVSPREATRSDLMRFVTTRSTRTMLELDEGVELIEAGVPADSPLDGMRVEDVEWPAASGLVALLHGQTASVPAAGDEIGAGDTLYAIVGESARREFAAMFD